MQRDWNLASAVSEGRLSRRYSNTHAVVMLCRERRPKGTIDLTRREPEQVGLEHDTTWSCLLENTVRNRFGGPNRWEVRPRTDRGTAMALPWYAVAWDRLGGTGELARGARMVILGMQKGQLVKIS